MVLFSPTNSIINCMLNALLNDFRFVSVFVRHHSVLFSYWYLSFYNVSFNWYFANYEWQASDEYGHTHTHTGFDECQVNSCKYKYYIYFPWAKKITSKETRGNRIRLRDGARDGSNCNTVSFFFLIHVAYVLLFAVLICSALLYGV